jgi:hypothetical protein
MSRRREEAMGDRGNFDNRVAVGRALRLRREIEAFEARWPAPVGTEEAMPTFTWVELERQLVDLAATDTQAEMARHLVSATRKLARFKPSEMVLREILCLTWVLLDENFRPEVGVGSADSS